MTLHVAWEQSSLPGAFRARRGALSLPASSRWLDESCGSEDYTLLCQAVPTSPQVVETAYPWRQRDRAPLSRILGG